MVALSFVLLQIPVRLGLVVLTEHLARVVLLNYKLWSFISLCNVKLSWSKECFPKDRKSLKLSLIYESVSDCVEQGKTNSSIMTVWLIFVVHFGAAEMMGEASTSF